MRDLAMTVVGGFALVGLAVTDGQAGSDLLSLQVSRESGRQIGVLCHFLDPDHNPPPYEAGVLCESAAERVERRAHAFGKSVVRLGLRDVTGTDRDDGNDGSAVDGPVLLLVMEERPDWAGRGQPRLLLRARPVRGGATAPIVGVPPLSVSLGSLEWREPAEAVLGQVIDFALRD